MVTIKNRHGAYTERELRRLGLRSRPPRPRFKETRVRAPKPNRFDLVLDGHTAIIIYDVWRTKQAISKHGQANKEHDGSEIMIGRPRTKHLPRGGKQPYLKTACLAYQRAVVWKHFLWMP